MRRGEGMVANSGSLANEQRRFVDAIGGEGQ